MESATSRRMQEERRQTDIRKKIAALQAQLDGPQDSALAGASKTITEFDSPKRKHTNGTLLAPASPSPKKRKIDTDSLNRDKRSLTKSAVRYAGTAENSPLVYPATKPYSSTPTPRPAVHPSNVLNKLSQLGGRSVKPMHVEAVERSGSFSEKPTRQVTKETHEPVDALARDDRLALIEELEPGPVDHQPPFDDPFFEKLEPNSGIHLSSRTIPHDDLQEYLTGRFYLSPSKLYSVIRLLPNNQGYDVPVAGDWVTIAVVAERGPIKVSRAPVAIDRIEEQDEDTEHIDASTGPNPPNRESWKSKGKGKGKDADGPRRPSGRKYVNLKLIDFGARSKSSASGGTSIIRGDAFLSLLLFESDSFDFITREGGRKEKIYRGGSKGAFETMAKLREGSVVALLNPRVLKPFQHSNESPHPTTNILALTPESAGSVAVIGHSQHLGMCTVLKRDGKVCGGWCDKRVSDICEYHVQSAVEHRRAGRAEFSMGTSGMSTAAPKRKPVFDPTRKWGLKPDPDKATGPPTDSGGSTYIVAGHVVSGSASDSRGLFVGENVGRDAQAKAQRKMAGLATEKTLKKLLERDKEGMKAVQEARDYAKRMKEKEKAGKGKGKGREEMEKGKKKVGIKEKAEGSEGEEPKNTPTQKNAYSAEVIKKLGFDPTLKLGQRRVEDTDIQAKLRTLASARSSTAIELGPRPGARVRSAVSAPSQRGGHEPQGVVDSVALPDLDDFDLEREEEMVFGKSLDVKMVDLDSSDIDSETEQEALTKEPSRSPLNLDSDEEPSFSYAQSNGIAEPDSSDEEFQKVFGKPTDTPSTGMVDLGSSDEE